MIWRNIILNLLVNSFGVCMFMFWDESLVGIMVFFFLNIVFIFCMYIISCLCKFVIIVLVFLLFVCLII